MPIRKRLYRLRPIMRVLLLAALLAAVPLTLSRAPWQQVQAHSQPVQTCKPDKHGHLPDRCVYHQNLPGNDCTGGTFFVSGQGDGRGNDGEEVVIQANGDFYLANQHGDPVHGGGGATVIPDHGCVLAIFDPRTGTYIPVHSGELHGGQTYVLIPPPGHGTATVTPTPRPSTTATASPTPTFTPSQTATRTPSATVTRTPSPTVTSTPSRTATRTPSPTVTRTPSRTATFTPRPTATYTPRPTATFTPRPTATPRHHEHHYPTATPTPRHHEYHAPTATATRHREHR